jgi:hypothetical protein
MQDKFIDDRHMLQEEGYVLATFCTVVEIILNDNIGAASDAKVDTKENAKHDAKADTQPLDNAATPPIQRPSSHAPLSLEGIFL